jgi:glycosyltransferase involved in cell wall biosynthesis
MKLAFVSNGDPLDTRAFSGTPFFALRELRRRYGEGNVQVVNTPWFDHKINQARRLNRFGILPPRTPLVASIYAAMLTRRIEEIRPDAVVCVQAAQKILSFLDRWPCMLVADVTVGPLLDYYPAFAKIGARARRLADAQEASIVHSRSSIVLSSNWAAECAAKYYDAPLSRFVVAPLGANFLRDPETAEAPVGGPLKLLFVGYDWERKGGDIALATFKLLRLRAPDAEFHVVGCRPEAALETPGVTVYGRLSKEDPGQTAQLLSLFRDSSFFFMPTRNEAFGLVFSEACAFGLPPVAGETGGVGTIIHNDQNGLLLPYDATPEAYADAIFAVWSDAGRYQTMRRTARAAYEERLNWRSWGDKVDAELRRITPPARAGAAAGGLSVAKAGA